MLVAPDVPSRSVIGAFELRIPQRELQATIADLNAVVAKAGFSDTRYRLFKVTGTQAGTYNYLLESSWPGGDAYDQVHKSPEWREAAQKHPDFQRITKDQVYNRYVEVLPTKQ